MRQTYEAYQASRGSETQATLAEKYGRTFIAAYENVDDTTKGLVFQQAAEEIEEVLLSEYRLTRGQLDGLWSYVGNKGEKKTIPRQMKAGSSGALP